MGLDIEIANRSGSVPSLASTASCRRMLCVSRMTAWAVYRLRVRQHRGRRQVEGNGSPRFGTGHRLGIIIESHRVTPGD